MSERGLRDYEVPIHRSLLRPVLWLGVERRFGIANIACGAALAMLTDYHPIALALITLGVSIAHVVAMRQTAQDAYRFETYALNVRYQRFYPARCLDRRRR